MKRAFGMFAGTHSKYLGRRKRTFYRAVDHTLRGLRPGEALVADVCNLGQYNNIGRVFLHAVIDMCTGYTFCSLSAEGCSERLSCIALMREKVIPHLAGKHLAIGRLFAEGGTEFVPGVETGRIILDIMSFEVLSTPTSNAIAERFFLKVSRDFFEPHRDNEYGNIGALMDEFNVWLRRYNAAAEEYMREWSSQPG